MVVKMMKWRPWPPLSTKKFEAKIIVRNLRGLQSPNNEAEKTENVPDFSRLAVEIKWKGSKGNALSSLRRSVRRNFTKEESLKQGEDGVGVVEWNEEFLCVCTNFVAYNKDGIFHPWEVVFSLFNGLNRAPSSKVPILATAILNIADFASAAEEKDIEISVPLQVSNCSNENSPSLCLSLRLLELRTDKEPSDVMQRRSVSPPLVPEILTTEKPEVSPLMASLSKVKIFKGLSSRRTRKASPEDEGSDGPCSVRSEDVEYNSPLGTDSTDEVDDGESEEGKEDSSVENSINYGTLAYANHAGGSLYSYSSGSESEDWIYYSRQKSAVGNLYTEDSPTSILDQSAQKSSKHRILPWKKRKLSFKSPKTRGEPLLKKGEEGGDDIDFDRRQFSSCDESSLWNKNDGDSSANRSSFSEFGDDNFAVGSWEQKEITSRDGHMKLKTQVFFASIDQRNERAAGEGACTALVSVIADWLQSNQDEMPIKSQFDTLIREGSSEWRKLCENEIYRERFPDKHFDLETVINAKVRPLTVVPDKSFIGFFQPEGIEDGGFDFLQGAMSFDNIWNEISESAAESPANGDPVVYIVSWNDHFFILKVERDAYYIIDTLGERLYEGCTQAFILKFDKDTTIQQLPEETQQSNETPVSNNSGRADTNEPVADMSVAVSTDASSETEEEPPVVCRGKESCQEYIKKFLAAIPIRELQVDLKKGLMASTLLHHRLQIEFHYTNCLQMEVDSSSEDSVPVMAAVLLPEDGTVIQD